MSQLTHSLLALLAVPALLSQAPAPRPAPGGGLFACPEGGGTVRLLWMPLADSLPPGGWRVLDASGKVLVPRIPMPDPALVSSLPKDEAELVQKLGKALAEAKTASERKLILLNAFVKAGNAPDTGKALGLTATLHGLPSGKRSFVLVGLDAHGTPGPLRFESEPVDPASPAPLPPPPAGLKLAPQGRGMALSWSPVKAQVPVMDYRVKRDGVLLTDRPFILGVSWKEDSSQYVDREAALEADHEYQVCAVDLFGRPGPAASAKAFLPDPSALDAPSGLKAEAQPGRNLVSWQAPKNASTAGLILERSIQYGGPWEALLPQALSRDATRHEDTDLEAGTTYFYRIRSVNPRGETGEASTVVSAQAKAADKVAPPEGLKAQGGSNRVRLNWVPAARPVAGYLVERRVGSVQAWVRLNADPLTVTNYDDYLGDGAVGTYVYRIKAVDFDSTLSEPSLSAEVILEDLAPPPVPHLMAASGLKGQVLLRFRPAPPVERTASFLVLRSQPDMGEEVVIGDPLPSTATEFTDPWVEPGQVYRYRLVAVAPKGIRSEPSTRLDVFVGAPDLDAPPRPEAAYADKPFACVKLRFPEAPEQVRYFLQRKAQGQVLWLQVQGPLNGSEAMDVNPPDKGKVLYRLYAESADGSRGRAGEPVEVAIP